MKWLRLYDDLLDDLKAQQLPPATFKHWINLLCLASKGEPRGTLPDLNVIAFRLRLTTPKAGALIEELSALGFIDRDDDGTLRPHNWQGRQPMSDNVAARVRKHRAAVTETDHVTVDVTLHDRFGNALDIDRDTETETDTDSVSNDTGDAAPKKPLPEHGEAQKIVAAYCREAGIDAPANYARAVGLAGKLAKAGISAEDVPALFAASNWGDGADLGKMLGMADRFRAAKHAPPQPRKYPEPLQKRIDLWTAERLAGGKPILPYPEQLQSALDDYAASQNGVRR